MCAHVQSLTRRGSHDQRYYRRDRLGKERVLGARRGQGGPGSALTGAPGAGAAFAPAEAVTARRVRVQRVVRHHKRTTIDGFLSASLTSAD